MNRKIPYHELATLLAGHCNISPTEAEDFIKSFFEQLTRSLTDGETVKIKGIGTFAPTGDADMPVSFIPDSEIADTINAPFAMFEPEEVSDSLSDDAFSRLDATEEADSEELVEQPEAPQEGQDLPETTSDTIEQIEIPEPTAITETAQPLAEQQPTVDPEPEAESAPSEEVISEPATESESEQVSVPVQPEQPAPESSVEQTVATPSATESATPVQSQPATVTPPAPEKPTAQPAPVKPIVPASTVVTPKPAPSFPEEEPEEYYHEPEHKSGAGFGWGFIIGMLVGLAIGACGVYFAIDYIFPTMPQASRNDIEEAELVENLQLDSVAAPLADDSVKASAASVAATTADTLKVAEKETPVQTQAAPEVKDTVRPGYLLNDMAKKHYGNKCFWVYIYEENKSKIANPNRVGPGLELVIPPAEKYGIDSSSQASIKAANEKAGKILAKYPK